MASRDTKSGKLTIIEGSGGNDTLSFSDGGDFADGTDVFRAYGGDDTITGGVGRDRFIFESNAESNGVDTITDFADKDSGTNADVLDLSYALAGKKITSSNVSAYVMIDDADSNGVYELYIDAGGNVDVSDPVWAYLDGSNIEAGDLVNIRTSAFDGWITVV